MELNVNVDFRRVLFACYQEAKSKYGAFEAIHWKGIKVDDIVRIIKESKDKEEAVTLLRSKLNFSTKDATAVLKIDSTSRVRPSRPIPSLKSFMFSFNLLY